MTRPLVSSYDKILHTKLEPFSFENPPVNPIELSNELITAMTEYNGLGLSANQLGYPYRVFVMRSEQPMVCFNPRIVDSSAIEVTMEEGCLSYPFLYVKIKRPAMIKARFQTYDGSVMTAKFDGMTARVFQHELDHLQGIDFTRRANPIHLERAKRQQVKFTRAHKRGQLHFRETGVDAAKYDEYLKMATLTKQNQVAQESAQAV